MILKRVLPVIVAIAVLCCMMIVPASAASYYDPDSSSTQFYSIASFSLDVYLSNGDVLALECPEVIPHDGLNYSGSVSSNTGSISYAWISSHRGYDESLGLDLVSWSLIVDPSVQIVAFDLHFDDVVLTYDDWFFDLFLEVSAANFSSVDAYSCSLNVVFPNEDEQPMQKKIAASSTSLFNFAQATHLYDKLDVCNIEPGAQMLVTEGKVHGELRGHNQLNFSSLFTYDRNLLPSADDFLFDNGLAYEHPYYSEVTSRGLVYFLTDGVGAFLDVPLFGSISLGGALGVFFSVLLVSVLIKMFAS